MGLQKAANSRYLEPREAYFRDLADRQYGAVIALGAERYATIQEINPVIEMMKREGARADLFYRAEQIIDRLWALRRSKRDLWHGASVVEVAAGADLVTYSTDSLEEFRAWLHNAFLKAHRRLRL